MASALCKMLDLTGPEGFPDTVAIGIVRGGQRFTAFTVRLTPNAEIQMTLFEFGDQDFIPFEDLSQIRLGLNNAVGDGRDLGETIIDVEDASQGETTKRFHPAGITGPFYELTYRVLPATP